MVKGVMAACSLASILISSSRTSSVLVSSFLLVRRHRNTSIRLFSSRKTTSDVYHVKHNDDRSTLASLAKNRKTLKRLGPMVDLATTTTTCASSSSKIAADIGCDHGLLTYGLAAAGYFESVIGVDVSPLALEQGAFSLLQASQQDDEEASPSSKSESTSTTKISFLLGDGLEPLVNQDTDSSSSVVIDTVCVAGMGVHSMIDILNAPHLDHIACQRIVVQPTNSRPRHMVMLYQHLLRQDFVVEREYMVFLSRRWYLNTSFVRRKNARDKLLLEDVDDLVVLPGQMLESNSSTSSTTSMPDQEEQRRLYKTYVDHHVKWLRRDQEQTGHPPQYNEDRQWLNAILKTRETKQ